MEFRSNLHSHTQFSDGNHTVEEMAKAAIEKNFVSLGFSDHSYVPNFEESLRIENTANYLAEIARVKDLYKDQIEIYAGIEWDYYSDPEKIKDFSFDYTIGSVHDIKVDGNFYTVDYLAESIEEAIAALAGNEKKFCEIYYETVVDLVKNDQPDIIGHLDLLKKLNGKFQFFDEDSSWYKNLCLETVDFLAEGNNIVEINTGGMARKYREDPYPSDLILRRALEKKIPLTLSSDCHDQKNIDFAFVDICNRLENLGCKMVVRMEKGVWNEIPL